MLIYLKQIFLCFIANYWDIFKNWAVHTEENQEGNNKDITIDHKTLFWKTWVERGIYYVRDLLNEDGKFLSLDEFNETFGLKPNYLPNTFKLELPS